MSLYLMPVNEGRRVPLKKTVVFIGRHPDCDVVLNKSMKISRRHCCLALVNNQLFVRDLGSMNGIQVNGVRVQCEQHLRLGDELIIGDVPFIVKSKATDELEKFQDLERDRTELLPPGQSYVVRADDSALDEEFADDDNILLDDEEDDLEEEPALLDVDFAEDEGDVTAGEKDLLDPDQVDSAEEEEKQAIPDTDSSVPKPQEKSVYELKKSSTDSGTELESPSFDDFIIE